MKEVSQRIWFVLVFYLYTRAQSHEFNDVLSLVVLPKDIIENTTNFLHVNCSVSDISQEIPGSSVLSLAIYFCDSRTSKCSEIATASGIPNQAGWNANQSNVQTRKSLTSNHGGYLYIKYDLSNIYGGESGRFECRANFLTKNFTTKTVSTAVDVTDSSLTVKLEDCDEIFRDFQTWSNKPSVSKDAMHSRVTQCMILYQKKIKALPSLSGTAKVGGLWVPIMRRISGGVNFDVGWAEYKAGFGQETGDFWIGLDKMHQLTSPNGTELIVTMIHENGSTAYAKFKSFQIGDESSGYQLHVSRDMGTAGQHFHDYHDGAKFSTKDRENDVAPSNCAVDLNGGWWYINCFYVKLTGLFNTNGDRGIQWRPFAGHTSRLTYAEMSIKIA